MDDDRDELLDWALVAVVVFFLAISAALMLLFDVVF